MDNRIFNINGKGEEMLLRALALAFEQDGTKAVKGWRFTQKHGLILLAWIDGNTLAQKFPSPLSAAQVLPIVSSWLKTDEAASVELTYWDRDCDHDGHNSKGWRVYVEDWGHVNDEFSAVCAIKPVYLWYGK